MFYFTARVKLARISNREIPRSRWSLGTSILYGCSLTAIEKSQVLRRYIRSAEIAPRSRFTLLTGGRLERLLRLHSQEWLCHLTLPIVLCEGRSSEVRPFSSWRECAARRPSYEMHALRKVRPYEQGEWIVVSISGGGRAQQLCQRHGIPLRALPILDAYDGFQRSARRST